MDGAAGIAAFEARYVEQVVDQGVERLRLRDDGHCRGACSAGGSCYSDSASAINAVSGVRTSCEMAASSALRSRSGSISPKAC